MTRPARQMDHPAAALDDAALAGDAGLRRLRAFRRIAERGLIHGDADERAVAARIFDYLDTGAEGGLEAALGLAGPGHTGALRRYRQERRDGALCALWRVVWPGLTASAAAPLMAREWRRYAANVWPRHKAAGIMPADEPSATFARLLTVGNRPLASETLRKVLATGHLQPVEATSRPRHIDHERRPHG